MSVIILFDEVKYNSDIEQFTLLANEVQPSIDAYNLLGYSVLNNDDFKRLFTDTAQLLFDKMTVGVVTTIGGLEIDKQKAIDLFKRPAGYDNVIMSVNKTIDTLSNHSYAVTNIPPISISSYFALDGNGKVVLADTLLSARTNQYTYKATSVKAMAALAFAQAVIDKINELGIGNFVNKNPNGFRGFIGDLIDGEYNKDQTLNVKGIMRYNEDDNRF